MDTETVRAQKAKLQAIEDARFTVGDLSFEKLEDAAQAAAKASEGAKRSQITTVMRRHIQGGYGGISRVVAHFFDGQDMRAIAADEDGIADLALRATALVTKSKTVPEKPKNPKGP